MLLLLLMMLRLRLRLRQMRAHGAHRQKKSGFLSKPIWGHDWGELPRMGVTSEVKRDLQRLVNTCRETSLTM